ncbi:MAG TPA: hypothetical protein VNS33_13235 [Bradyrhizobium sp.]|nr:hypothetical protein [Bradyrhizobium sp.]
MSHLEPNIIALSWFTLLWSVCCLGFFQIAGMYPIHRRGGDGARMPTLLVLGNTALWLVLLAGTLAFACAELRWTTIVVVAGILFLFIPELFQAIPDRWRDGHAGMAIAGCILAAALGLLAYLAADPIRWLHA